VWSAIATASVSALFLAPLWGRLADRVGNKPVLALTTVGAGTLMPLTPDARPRPGGSGRSGARPSSTALVRGAIGPAMYFNLALSNAPQANTGHLHRHPERRHRPAGFIGSLASQPPLHPVPGPRAPARRPRVDRLPLGSSSPPACCGAQAWRLLLRPVAEDRAGAPATSCAGPHRGSAREPARPGVRSPRPRDGHPLPLPRPARGRGRGRAARPRVSSSGIERGPTTGGCSRRSRLSSGKPDSSPGPTSSSRALALLLHRRPGGGKPSLGLARAWDAAVVACRP
jgi:hypothetical protein